MKCPACGSPLVYPSRLRNIVERTRHLLTGREPHRCHQCGWRRWRNRRIHEPGPDVTPDDLRTSREARAVTTDDLDQLDRASR